MSSVARIALAAAVANQAQVRSALAAKLVKSSADSQQSIVAVIEAAAENLESIANGALAPGVGGNLDVRA